MSCESWDSNEQFDCIPMPAPDDHLNPVVLYLGANMERYMTHPYASPLFGDFTGLPPMLIQSGDSEVLRDEITLLAHKASLAGVQVQHELYEDAVSLHGCSICPGLMFFLHVDPCLSAVSLLGINYSFFCLHAWICPEILTPD